MRPQFDLRLYLLIDPEHCHDRHPAEIAAAAVRGGATLVQYRDKRNTTRDQVRLAHHVMEACAASAVPLLINDWVDVALAVKADGVHLGRDDMPVERARAILGDTAIIGGTVHFPEEADAIDPSMVDYVGLGPVFATSSKTANDPALGVGGLGSLLGYWRKVAPGVPACGISGINQSNAADVLTSGVEGIAVISAIGMADDVEAATRDLRRVVDAAVTGDQAA
ncbi:MAG: thiamine phosphate synthase [Pseudomonadota bacterium]